MIIKWIHMTLTTIVHARGLMYLKQIVMKNTWPFFFFFNKHTLYVQEGTHRKYFRKSVCHVASWCNTLRSVQFFDLFSRFWKVAGSGASQEVGIEPVKASLSQKSSPPSPAAGHQPCLPQHVSPPLQYLARDSHASIPPSTRAVCWFVPSPTCLLVKSPQWFPCL